MRVLPGETEIQSQERALADLNCQYLQCEMERLKLLLARRALWLKEEWKSDPLKSYSGMVISDERFDHLLREPRKGEAEFYEASAEVSLRFIFTCNFSNLFNVQWRCATTSTNNIDGSKFQHLLNDISHFLCRLIVLSKLVRQTSIWMSANIELGCSR